MLGHLFADHCGHPELATGELDAETRRVPGVPRALLLVRYEDMKADPARELRRVAEFIGLRDVRDDHIPAAVEHASFANMRARETARPADGTRFAAGRADDTESFKTRRGEVGGHRTYLTPAQVEWLDALIRDGMDDWYGYGRTLALNLAQRARE